MRVKQPTMIITRDNSICWFMGDMLHKRDGPAYIYSDNNSDWPKFVNGQVIYNTTFNTMWAIYNMTHRLSGPAIFNEYTNRFQFYGFMLNV